MRPKDVKVKIGFERVRARASFTSYAAMRGCLKGLGQSQSFAATYR